MTTSDPPLWPRPSEPRRFYRLALNSERAARDRRAMLVADLDPTSIKSTEPDPDGYVLTFGTGFPNGSVPLAQLWP